MPKQLFGILNTSFGIWEASIWETNMVLEGGRQKFEKDQNSRLSPDRSFSCGSFPTEISFHLSATYPFLVLPVQRMDNENDQAQCYGFSNDDV